MKKNPLFFLRVGCSLMLIAACVGLLLAAVNAVTEERIAQNLAEQDRSAIASIFGECDAPIEVDFPASSNVSALYRIEQGGSLLGYCAKASSIGFKDTVSLMVGTDAKGACIGVQITAMSETPGIGSKVADPSHLSAYIGKSGSITLGKEIHAVSGATVTSKAVHEAVSAALTLIGQSLGTSPLPETAAPEQTEAVNVPEQTASPDAESSAPTSGTVPFLTETIAVTDIVIRETTESSASSEEEDSDSPEQSKEPSDPNQSGDEDESKPTDGEEKPVAPSEDTSQSSEQTDSPEPSAPSDPSDTTEPSAPSDPSDSTDSTDSTEPADTTEPTDTVDATDSADSADSTEGEGSDASPESSDTASDTEQTESPETEEDFSDYETEESGDYETEADDGENA